MIVVLLGAPGSGKGTQAKFLAQSLGLGHLSTGDLLRAESLKDSPLSLKIRDILRNGSYVDDHCIMELLRQNFLKFFDNYKGCILDGLPRTLTQAQVLELFLGEIGQCLTASIYITVPDECLLSRLTGRFVCEGCQFVYHKVFKLPLKSGVCNYCGSEKFYVREDDRAELVSKRLNNHHVQIGPLLTFYQERGLLRTVDGSQEIPLVSKQILATLERFL